jgi:hypothetical protein
MIYVTAESDAGRPVLLVFKAFEMEAGFSEIDQETDLEIVCLEVVDCLSQMHIFYFGNSLKLDRKHTIDKKVYPSRSDVVFTIVNRHFEFSEKQDIGGRHVDADG